MTSNSIARTRWAAVGAAVAVTLGAVGIGSLNIANADVSSGDRPVFVSINPCRLLDTRPGDNNVGPLSAPIGADTTVTIQAHGTNGECTGPSTIPTDAVALSLNVTAVGPTANTFLTFWGTGDNPGTSNLNPRAGGAPTPNSVSTPLSATGSFNIFNNAGNVNVIVDVNGYYANHNHDDRYYTETEADDRFVTQSEGDERFQRSAETLLVGGLEFHDRAAVASSWEWDGGAVRHSAVTAGEECIRASFELPPDVEVTGAELVYSADGSVEVSVTVDGLIGVGGTVEAEADALQRLAEVSATVPANLPDEIAARDLELGANADEVDSSRFNYSANVCTGDVLIVYGLKLSLAPSS